MIHIKFSSVCQFLQSTNTFHWSQIGQLPLHTTKNTTHLPCSPDKVLFFVTELVEWEDVYHLFLSTCWYWFYLDGFLSTYISELKKVYFSMSYIDTEHFLYRTFLVWLRRSTLRGRASSPSMTSATACRLSCMVGLLSDIIYPIRHPPFPPLRSAFREFLFGLCKKTGGFWSKNSVLSLF